MVSFKVVSKYEPMGDQKQAIEKISEIFSTSVNKKDHVVLKGATGTGKTYTLAKSIERLNEIEGYARQILVLSPNKTLASQLYQELKDFFPDNAVGYFISYYDYYLPESYLPTKDLYIEKETSINAEIERYRNEATRFLIERDDVIIVASVSAIYGLGSPQYYRELGLLLKKGELFSRADLISSLIDIQYSRNESVLNRGSFHAKGDRVELYPIYEWNLVRIDFFGDEIDSISIVDPLNKVILEKKESILILPASHYVTPQNITFKALETIENELSDRLEYFLSQGKILEAERLRQRTNYDLEMLKTTGFCQGIENYSIHFDLDHELYPTRDRGQPPYSLIDYFNGEKFLIVLDESHAMLPQIRGMYEGDKSRKQNLVDYGFRLPCAFDNRPLKFDEFLERVHQVLYMSATPGDLESGFSGGKIIEQIIRPTGLLDPEVIVKPTEAQIDDLITEIHAVVTRGERILVTTLTKKMAEHLADYLQEHGIKTRYMHSEINTLERNQIIYDLRSGLFDVLVGINLLREGLDLPEVSLVAILDADKEGFLRNTRALIQTMGRAARNVHGRVVMYADKITDSMQDAIDETNRRRKIQSAFNEEHGITPQTIIKSIKDTALTKEKEQFVKMTENANEEEIESIIAQLTFDMKKAAESLDFEKAAKLRDNIIELKQKHAV
jgi:excinuclease ABC subunit B